MFGGASGTANLGSSLDWRTGWSAGADVTRWFSRMLGVRGDATLVRNDLNGSLATIPAGSKFNKFSYLGRWCCAGPAGATCGSSRSCWVGWAR